MIPHTWCTRNVWPVRNSGVICCVQESQKLKLKLREKHVYSHVYTGFHAHRQESKDQSYSNPDFNNPSLCMDVGGSFSIP